MSLSRKVIKVLSILTVIEGAFFVVCGVLVMTGILQLEDSDAAYIVMHTNGNKTFIGIVVLAVGIYEIIEGFLGVKGANNPAKMFPFLIAASGAIAYYGTEFLHSLLEDGIAWTMLITCILNCVVWYFAYKTYKETQK